MAYEWARFDLDVEDAQNELRFLIGCCMDKAQFQPDDIKIVRDAYDKDYDGERDGFRIFELQDGRIGVLQDGEDYTGHG